MERARARNQRYEDTIYIDLPLDVIRQTYCRYRSTELENSLKSADLSDARKEQRKNNMRKSEANFLRFLRTSEKPQNYTTLKIIGKGAFGEVKLVQRKHDGKIYALKSLIKAEMVRVFKRIVGVPELDTNSIDSTRRTNWHTSGPSAIFWPMRTAHG